MGAPEKACVSRKSRIQRHDLQARVFQGPHLGERLVPTIGPANGVCDFRNHDRRKDPSPSLAKLGQFRPRPRERILVACGVVGK